ncbi:hydroxymethylglutaryl-CoA lyase [Conexibacter sp. S30A1]|uniref:hydroxymethylglutaryl-CoA lyase n=1 Tax=Conexibacter sp. S30A1 TaxID=2937800 RepID=UPI00200BEF95|nr:hydroxymethylglutaryl-CoA lyase [Conexibacter sp. S30A1]
MNHPDSITIRDVTARDGLQGESRLVATEDKVRLLEMLGNAGFRRINATSFVSSRAVPQMADAEEVMAHLRRRSDVTYDASVPNIKGAERAIASGVDVVVVFVAASDVGNRSNVRRSTEESMSEAEAVIRRARESGIGAIGTVSTAFGSPYGDEITIDGVRAMVARFVGAGATGIALGDTSGEANPDQVHEMVSQLLADLGDLELALHFHDTRGLALANVLAAMDAGAVHFDAAVGGIGGSPFTLNSGGNLAAEDLVWMCHQMRIHTGVDLDALFEIHDLLERLLGHALNSRVRVQAQGVAS